MQHVIETSKAFAWVTERLNRESLLTFAEALANALAQKINELETQIPENLQDTLQQLQNQLNEVYQKADVLEDFELGQVEEAIRQTLENLDAAGL
jgi:TolA-binding protein